MDARLLKAAIPRLGPEDKTIERTFLKEGSANLAIQPSLKRWRVDDYLLEGVLAEGGFGSVYRGRHIQDGSLAAIKILHADLLSRSDIAARFEREIDVIQRLRHPNIVKILSRGRLEDGLPYFAMELLDGVNLEQYLSIRGRLLLHEVLWVLDPLSNALEAVHTQGIVHRDLKASNIFLCQQNDTRRIVLFDFGVAKLLDMSIEPLTSSRHVIGSIECIAPEQLLNLPVDARTDVYALGVLTYKMVVGKPPFSGTVYSDLRHQHLHLPPPRPSSQAPVHSTLDDVILRAMSKDPEERQPSAKEFFAELQQAAMVVNSINQATIGPRIVRSLGVYVHLHVGTGGQNHYETHLDLDLQNILTAIARDLSKAGFTLVKQSPIDMLLTLNRLDNPVHDEVIRHGAIETVVNLHKRIQQRDGRDPRVQLRIYLHTGDVLEQDDGTLLGGEMLDIRSWLPEHLDEGLWVSLSVLRGMRVPMMLLSQQNSSFVRLGEVKPSWLVERTIS